MPQSEHWKIQILPPAEAGLLEILEEHGDEAYAEATKEILALEEDPTPPDAQRVRRTKDHYRIYIYRSLYRAIYRVLIARHVVLVEDLGPRGSVYLKGGYERW